MKVAASCIILTALVAAQAQPVAAWTGAGVSTLAPPVAVGSPIERLVLHLSVDVARRTLADEPPAAVAGARFFFSARGFRPYVEAGVGYTQGPDLSGTPQRKGPLRYQVAPRVELTVGKIVTSVGGGVLYAFRSGIRIGIGTNFMKVPGMPSAIQVLAPLQFRF